MNSSPNIPLYIFYILDSTSRNPQKLLRISNPILYSTIARFRIARFGFKHSLLYSIFQKLQVGSCIANSECNIPHFTFRIPKSQILDFVSLLSHSVFRNAHFGPNVFLFQISYPGQRFWFSKSEAKIAKVAEEKKQTTTGHRLAHVLFLIAIFLFL